MDLLDVERWRLRQAQESDEEVAPYLVYLEHGERELRRRWSHKEAELVLAERGHFDVVSFLLTGNRANVNQTDGDGATALHYAAAYGNASVVWRLLERGAQPNSVLPNGATAFFLAAQNGHSPVLQLLLSLPGVDPHAKVTNSSGEAVR